MPRENTEKFTKLAVRLKKNIEQNIIRIALDIHANLVDTTPRDTGWAANNWIPQIGVPYKNTVGSPEAVDSSTSMAKAGKVIGWKSGDGPINITNNVPYIGILNDGYSDQAPAGFVQKAVQKAVNDLNRGLK